MKIEYLEMTTEAGIFTSFVPDDGAFGVWIDNPMGIAKFTDEQAVNLRNLLNKAYPKDLFPSEVLDDC